MPGAWTFVDIGTFWHPAISFWQCRTLSADKLGRGRYSMIWWYSCLNWLFSILRLIDFLMHSPLAASSRHLDPVLHQTEAEAKRQSYMNSWRLSILLSICPWFSFLLIERWRHGPRAGWSGRSRRSKTCWRWRRHWRRRSLGEVEKGPVGVTGDQVPISGTRVRHVPLKSNVHSTPRIEETEVQPLSELASSTYYSNQILQRSGKEVDSVYVCRIFGVEKVCSDI